MKIFAILSMLAGLYFLISVKTDVGILCSVIVIQIGGVIILLEKIANNTAAKTPAQN